jgi:hypothetical protein
MRPIDWLLVFCALKGAPDGLDPVRIQKGMFRFAQESGVPEDELYTFAPYHYGPMSRQLYADVDALEARGLIHGTPVEGYSWKRYRATPVGIEMAQDVAARGDRAGLNQLWALKRELAGQSFAELLRDVYDRYPDYAANSVFRG